MTTIKGNVPSKSNQYRISGNGMFYKSKEVKDYEKNFAWQYKTTPTITVPFELSISVYVASARQDLDGTFKVILDCLQKCRAIENDNLCYRILAEKFIDKNNPRIEFKLTEI